MAGVPTQTSCSDHRRLGEAAHVDDRDQRSQQFRRNIMPVHSQPPFGSQPANGFIDDFGMRHMRPCARITINFRL
jgi:hypothetical protein